MYEEPKSFSLQDKSLAQVQSKILPKIDIKRLLAEEQAREQDWQHPGPLRFAVAAEVNYTLENSGNWQNLDDGRLWRLIIQSPGAKSLNLGITRFDMPEGAKLWIYDPGHKHVEGPYTARHRSKTGSLWTPVIEGDEIIVEVFVPNGVTLPIIEIGKVNQGFLGLEKVGEKSGVTGNTEGTCNNDVVCAVGNPWSNQIRAVGVYTINGTAACTGTLMNNTALDFKPYVLSANHCKVNSSNDATIVMYWNFQSATCSTHGPGSTADNQTGATYHASYAPSDFSLFELSSQPDPSFNVWYSGWDASGTAPSATVSIHQPRGDVKAISFSNTGPTTFDVDATTDPWTITSSASGNHWRANWDSGVTEKGSSGACLFETTNGRCIGQLHGGPSSCGVASSDMHDYYGRISTSWNGGGTADKRLRDWLDPVPTGSLNLDGDPHITSANGVHYDFQGAGEYVALRDSNGLEIQTRMAPIATTFNPGPDPHDGIASCVSLNTAVAARVGEHRVTYEPNFSGVPDPSGLQLRVDGKLTTLGSAGNDLGGGGRISKTSAPGGLEIDFPDASTLYVTPGWWDSEKKWYLNVDVVRPPVMNGISGGSPVVVPTEGNISVKSDRGEIVVGSSIKDANSARGLMAQIQPGSWLPVLPNGASMGSMPSVVHDRYVDLYQKFGEAWRVTDSTSLFDYAPGTSTDTFTMRNWPLEHPPCLIPHTKPVQPTSERVAQEACRLITDKNMHANCIFDVRVTGNTGFGKTYQVTQQLQPGATEVNVKDDKDPTQYGENVTFIATVALTKSKEEVPTGAVQFTLDKNKVGSPVKLDSKGKATWNSTNIQVGKHEVEAKYIPSHGSLFKESSSISESHTVIATENLLFWFIVFLIAALIIFILWWYLRKK